MYEEAIQKLEAQVIEITEKIGEHNKLAYLKPQRDWSEKDAHLRAVLVRTLDKIDLLREHQGMTTA